MGCVYMHSILVFISFRFFIVVLLYPTLMYTRTTRFVHSVSCTYVTYSFVCVQVINTGSVKQQQGNPDGVCLFTLPSSSSVL